jgi:thiol-disulfide isomerase/thioredoxin
MMTMTVHATTRHLVLVVLGLATPTADAFVACGLVSSPRDISRTASSSPRMSATNGASHTELERLFERPSFQPTAQPPDVTKVARELKQELKKPEYSLGRDPLGPVPEEVTAEMIADLTSKSTSVPKRATASKSAAISSVQTVSELRAVVAARPLVVVKYYAPWCRLCLTVKPVFELFANDVAEGDGSMRVANDAVESATFVEVDYEASRVLTKLAGFTRLPCVHIYREGALVGMHSISKPHQFADFKESVNTHLRSNRAYP